jgi:hypothetical protein
MSKKDLGISLEGTRQKGRSQAPQQVRPTGRWKVGQQAIYCSGLDESWGDDIVLKNLQA